MKVTEEFVKQLCEARSTIRKTSLITVYATPEKKISDISDQLRSEISTSHNIKDHQTQKAVSSALLDLMKAVKLLPQSTNGYLMLSGEVESCI